MSSKHSILDFRFQISDLLSRNTERWRVRRNRSLIVTLWPGPKKFNGGKDKDKWMPAGMVWLSWPNEFPAFI